MCSLFLTVCVSAGREKAFSNQPQHTPSLSLSLPVFPLHIHFSMQSEMLDGGVFLKVGLQKFSSKRRMVGSSSMHVRDDALVMLKEKSL